VSLLSRHERVYSMSREEFEKIARHYNSRVTPAQLDGGWAALQHQRRNWRRVQQTWLSVIYKGGQR
jgi:hypothetical protein